MQDRNYNNTGASESTGGGLMWAKIDHDNCRFLFGKENIPRNWMTAYLDGVELKWEDKSVSKKGNNIPAHAQLILRMSMKDDALGTPTEEGGPAILKFNLSLKSSDRTMFAEALNILAATGVEWDGWMRLGLYEAGNEKKSLRLKINTHPSQLDSSGKSITFPPTKFEWNTATNKGYIDVPSGVDTGFKQNGFAVIDWRAADSFWCRIAEALHRRWNNSEPPACPFEDFMYNASSAPVQQPAQAPQQAAPPVTAPTPATALVVQSDIDAFEAKAKKYWDRDTQEGLIEGARITLDHAKTAGFYSPAFTKETILKWFLPKIREVMGTNDIDLVIDENTIPLTVRVVQLLPF